MEHLSKLKVAAVQAAQPFPYTREKTLEKACRLIEDASRNGAKIIALSEAFIPVFPYWAYFDNSQNIKPKVVELFKNSVEIPSSTTDILCETAKHHGVYVIIGINERIKGSLGTLYNSQLFISDEGKILGLHRKLVPTQGEKLVHAGGDGSTLQVFKTKYGRVGGLICGEHINSLARFALLAMGEQIHVNSDSASWGDPVQWDAKILRARNHAYEGRVFVIASSGYLSEEMREELSNDYGIENLLTNGGGTSTIIGPWGEILAKADPNKEEIIYAEIDEESQLEGRISHDITGHYNRFDVLSLNFNDKALTPILINATQNMLDELHFRKVSEKARKEGLPINEILHNLIDQYL